MNGNGRPLSYENNPETRTFIHHLRDLITLLFPDPQPDVFTLDSFEYRYRLHGLNELNELAVRDIEQSQRINRALKDYFQSGLNEFHIGLIYLYWGECHAAEKQFDRAWRQWSFVHEPSGSSVAHLARGYAQRLVHQYEEAMISCGKALRELRSVSSASQTEFRERIEKCLEETQVALRDKMRPLPDTEPPQDDDKEDVSEQAEPEEEPEREPFVTESDADGDEEDEPQKDVPPPDFTNLSDDPMPIDGHRKVDDKYRWYVVERRLTEDILPQIHTGDWLLVYMEPEQSDLAPKPDEPVVIVSETESGSTIHLKPHASAPNAHGRIYLRTLTDAEGPFNRDTETGEVQYQFESVLRELDILGIVIGLWRPTAKVID